MRSRHTPSSGPLTGNNYWPNRWVGEAKEHGGKGSGGGGLEGIVEEEDGKIRWRGAEKAVRKERRCKDWWE